MAAASEGSQTPTALLDTLYSLPPSMIFQRRTTTPLAHSIHGSIALSDIQQRLQEDFGLREQDIEVAWKDQAAGDGKLRQVGNYDCVVSVRGHGEESAPLEIEITRLHE